MVLFSFRVKGEASGTRMAPLPWLCTVSPVGENSAQYAAGRKPQCHVSHPSAYISETKVILSLKLHLSLASRVSVPLLPVTETEPLLDPESHLKDEDTVTCVLLLHHDLSFWK